MPRFGESLVFFRGLEGVQRCEDVMSGRSLSPSPHLLGVPPFAYVWYGLVL